MIIGEQREAVIANIAAAARAGAFHAKVEINDPVLTPEQEKRLISRYLDRRETAEYRCKCAVVRKLADWATALVNRDTQIIGIEKLAGVTGGAILTCNHFSPLDNTVVRHLTRKLGKKRINIISQQSNFAMKGPIGFFMNYADTIPLSDDPHYMLRQLPQMLKTLICRDEFVLIYPEKEMWFHYRKPRPPMRGAYYFAAKLQAPVISCFVEQQETKKMDRPNFHRVRYVLHILDVLYPDAALPQRQSSTQLCQQDYTLKKAAYERIYGKPLCYDFAPEDIAGWTGAWQ